MSNSHFEPPFTLSGRWQYRLWCVCYLWWATLYVTVRRLLRGPLLPNWSWMLETSMFFLRGQSHKAFDEPDPVRSREFQDALTFASPALARMEIDEVITPVKGEWYQEKGSESGLTMLYLHGGGYAYYARAHRAIISLFTEAADARTFALDYPLIPEHRYPTQLNHALAAYRWLLETGIQAGKLVVAGDSAGGNLTLALLQAIRVEGLPQPAIAICICPWTDVSNPGKSMAVNEPFDWVEKRMADQWAEWLCDKNEYANPIISPVFADLKGLAPIYIQAGSGEILYDMICTFAEEGKKHGADVRLETWPNMPHDFQAFGDLVPEARDALTRFGEEAKQATH
jgi:epsilon-lactone hydrolase